MTLTTAPPSTPPPAPRVRQQVVLTGVSWETYRRVRSECDRVHVKMTYDRGTLEIMSPLPTHEIVARFIDQIITVACDELGIKLVGYRGTTWQKQAVDRGLEADDCYYIQHAELADRRGGAIDLDRGDPPPDLAVETDVTHSTVSKEAVYAALGVPELWRWDDGAFRVRLLEPGGHYADAPRSRALPMLPPEVVEDFIGRRLREGEWSTKAAFREWLRNNLRG